MTGDEDGPFGPVHLRYGCGIDVKLDLNFGVFFQDLAGSPETMCIRLPLSFNLGFTPNVVVYIFSYFRRR